MYYYYTSYTSQNRDDSPINPKPLIASQSNPEDQGVGVPLWPKLASSAQLASGRCGVFSLSLDVGVFRVLFSAVVSSGFRADGFELRFVVA